MKKELLFFFLLEQVVFVYFCIRFCLGTDVFSTLVGMQISKILGFYMQVGFVACLLARLLTLVVFNTITELKTQLLGLGLTGIGLVFVRWGGVSQRCLLSSNFVGYYTTESWFSYRILSNGSLGLHSVYLCSGLRYKTLGVG